MNKVIMQAASVFRSQGLAPLIGSMEKEVEEAYQAKVDWFDKSEKEAYQGRLV